MTHFFSVFVIFSRIKGSNTFVHCVFTIINKKKKKNKGIQEHLDIKKGGVNLLGGFFFNF